MPHSRGEGPTVRPAEGRVQGAAEADGGIEEADAACWDGRDARSELPGTPAVPRDPPLAPPDVPSRSDVPSSPALHHGLPAISGSRRTGGRITGSFLP